MAGNSGGVQSVERAFELLELIGRAGGECSLSHLSAESPLPPPTIHRLLRTLVGIGYVRQLPNRSYALGPRLIRLGEVANRQLGAVAVCLLIAWMADRTVRRRASAVPGSRGMEVGVGGMRRLVFPLVALVLVVLARAILERFVNVALLDLAEGRLLASESLEGASEPRHLERTRLGADEIGGSVRAAHDATPSSAS